MKKNCNSIQKIEKLSVHSTRQSTSTFKFNIFALLAAHWVTTHSPLVAASNVVVSINRFTVGC